MLGQGATSSHTCLNIGSLGAKQLKYVEPHFKKRFCILYFAFNVIALEMNVLLHRCAGNNTFGQVSIIVHLLFKDLNITSQSGFNSAWRCPNKWIATKQV